MSNDATPNLAEETLAALMCATATKAAPYLERLEPEDFPRWQHQRIFQALSHVTFPDDHSTFGSVYVQVHAHFLETGAYRDHDDGLRACFEDLVHHQGHVEQLDWLVSHLIEERFRARTVEELHSAIQYAETGPLEDVIGALRHLLDEPRRLYARIKPDTTPIAAMKGAAA